MIQVRARLRTIYRRVQRELSTGLGMYPRCFLPLWTATHPDASHQIARDTDLVIEGYPRSGNSFSEVAFRWSQRPNQVRLAHHIHQPAQIIQAVRWGVPAIVLIRQPEDAILSYSIYQPENSLRQSIRYYNRFYRSLLPYLNQCVVATFDQVTCDFGTIIENVNQTYSTNFVRFDHSPTSEQQVFSRLKKHARKVSSQYENQVAVPNAHRQSQREELRCRLHADVLSPLLDEAISLYAVFVEYSQGDDLKHVTRLNRDAA